MNIHNKNWAQYEYSYDLANSRENWAQKKKINPPDGCRSPREAATMCLKKPSSIQFPSLALTSLVPRLQSAAVCDLGMFYKTQYS